MGKAENATQIRSFLGLAGYYRRFFKGFSTIASPIIKLTQKNAAFKWDEDCENIFLELKKSFMIFSDAS